MALRRGWSEGKKQSAGKCFTWTGEWRFPFSACEIRTKIEFCAPSRYTPKKRNNLSAHLPRILSLNNFPINLIQHSLASFFHLRLRLLSSTQSQTQIVFHLFPCFSFSFSLLFRAFYKVLMEGTPEYLDYTEIMETFLSIEGVVRVHNLRIWVRITGEIIFFFAW